jgi:uncharacterized SAM-binding protein YcdF (DUF218 family)
LPPRRPAKRKEQRAKSQAQSAPCPLPFALCPCSPLKPFLSPLFEPLGALWLLMALSVLWLLWRRQWRSAWWLGLPTFLIFLAGSTPLVDTLVAREERQWARVSAQGSTGASPDPAASGLPAPRSSLPALTPLPEALAPALSNAPCDAVVALGGGQAVSRHDLLGFAVAQGGSRVLTAIELVRQGKAKTLVLGGSVVALPGKADVPAVSRVQEWVESWRLSAAAVTNLGLCADTHDEAVQFKKLQVQSGWKRVILVTSALHLRRAAAVFKKQGVEVIPFACDFQVYGVEHGEGWSPFPNQGRFVVFALYLHEKIGWCLYKWRGWL